VLALVHHGVIAVFIVVVRVVIGDFVHAPAQAAVSSSPGGSILCV